jgi:hypothetical protein
VAHTEETAQGKAAHKEAVVVTHRWHEVGAHGCEPVTRSRSLGREI